MALRVVRILWLVMCVGIVAWGVLQGGDATLVAAYLLGILTMPTGLIIYVLGSLAMGFFAKENPSIGITYDHASSPVIFILAILAGYIQWFALLPKLVRRMKNEKTPAAWGLVIVAFIAILYGLYRFYLHVFPSSNLS